MCRHNNVPIYYVHPVQIVIPGLTVDKLVSACILVNAYTTYPCLILVIQVSVLLPWPLYELGCDKYLYIPLTGLSICLCSLHNRLLPCH